MACPMLEKSNPQAKPSSEYPYESIYWSWSWILSSSTNLFLFAAVVCLAYMVYKSRGAKGKHRPNWYQWPQCCSEVYQILWYGKLVVMNKRCEFHKTVLDYQISKEKHDFFPLFQTLALEEGDRGWTSKTAWWNEDYDQEILKRFEEVRNSKLVIHDPLAHTGSCFDFQYYRSLKSYCDQKGKSRENGRNRTCIRGCHLMLLGYLLMALHHPTPGYFTHNRHPLTWGGHLLLTTTALLYNLPTRKHIQINLPPISIPIMIPFCWHYVNY